jgi:hypothetical protein
MSAEKTTIHFPPVPERGCMDGYRILDPKERLRRDDEYQTADGRWYKTICPTGAFQDGVTYRRKAPSAPLNVALEASEFVQNGRGDICDRCGQTIDRHDSTREYLCPIADGWHPRQKFLAGPIEVAPVAIQERKEESGTLANPLAESNPHRDTVALLMLQLDESRARAVQLAIALDKRTGELHKLQEELAIVRGQNDTFRVLVDDMRAELSKRDGGGK